MTFAWNWSKNNCVFAGAEQLRGVLRRIITTSFLSLNHRQGGNDADKELSLNNSSFVSPVYDRKVLSCRETVAQGHFKRPSSKG